MEQSRKSSPVLSGQSNKKKLFALVGGISVALLAFTIVLLFSLSAKSEDASHILEASSFKHALGGSTSNLPLRKASAAKLAPASLGRVYTAVGGVVAFLVIFAIIGVTLYLTLFRKATQHVGKVESEDVQLLGEDEKMISPKIVVLAVLAVVGVVVVVILGLQRERIKNVFGGGDKKSEDSSELSGDENSEKSGDLSEVEKADDLQGGGISVSWQKVMDRILECSTTLDSSKYNIKQSPKWDRMDKNLRFIVFGSGKFAQTVWFPSAFNFKIHEVNIARILQHGRNNLIAIPINPSSGNANFDFNKHFVDQCQFVYVDDDTASKEELGSAALIIKEINDELDKHEELEKRVFLFNTRWRNIQHTILNKDLLAWANTFKVEPGEKGIDLDLSDGNQNFILSVTGNITYNLFILNILMIYHRRTISDKVLLALDPDTKDVLGASERLDVSNMTSSLQLISMDSAISDNCARQCYKILNKLIEIYDPNNTLKIL